MAYREFHFEKIYEAPNTEILAEGLMRGAENTAAAIGNLFRGLAEQRAYRRKAADQYKFDLGQGKFENDDMIFFEQSRNITDRAKQEILATGRLSPQLEQDQVVATVNKKQSDWQFQTMQQFDKEIEQRAKDDKYYDPEIDRNKLRIAAYGENNDIYFSTRGERLEEFGKTRFTDPKSLLGKKYTFDYVGLFRQKEKERSTGSPTAENTVIDKTPFLNEQGVPGVTVKHAKEYLNSRGDGSVARWVESLVHDDMDNDVRYMKQRSAKFKGMSDDEAKLYLKAHPEENLYNKKDFATRVIEEAQKQLMEAASISSKIDYTTKVDRTITGGLYNNDAIGHSYTEHRDDNIQTLPSAGPRGEFVGTPPEPSENRMPGGSLLIGKGAKIGQPIPVAMKPDYIYDLRTGRNQRNNNSMELNLSGYQVQLTRKDGTPFFTTPDKIKDIPANVMQDLDPNVKVFLRGYTLERGNVLGEVSRRKSELDEELARVQGDEEKEAVVLEKIRRINDLTTRMNLSRDEFSDYDLLSASRQNGLNVNSIKRDVLVQPSESDLNIINRIITQGFDLRDRSKWSPDMVNVEQAFRQQYNSGGAQSQQRSDVNIKQMYNQQPSQSEPPLISSDEDYRKLKKGDRYRAPDGQIYTKTRD